jgi:hypothetical protein
MLNNRAFGGLILVLEAQTLYQLSYTIIVWEAQSLRRYLEPGDRSLSQTFQLIIYSTFKEVLLLDGKSYSLYSQCSLLPPDPPLLLLF